MNVVTGAFGYTGKHITQRLLSARQEARTITGHPGRTSPFGDQVRAYPLDFGDPDALAENLRGVNTLFNTYRVRFPPGSVTFGAAVENTKTLVNASIKAGAQRIDHISITNPSPDSPMGYFKGKAMAKEAIIGSGLAYNIIRPTLIFEAENALIKNIAWLLKKFPVFTVSDNGEYIVQPVHGDDVADAAISAAEENENFTQNCVSLEVYTYDQLIRLIADNVGSKAKIAHLRPSLALFLSRMAGYALRDVVLTRAEIDGLMAGLLVSGDPPNCHTSFQRWLEENGGTLGNEYASEMNRHYR